MTLRSSLFSIVSPQPPLPQVFRLSQVFADPAGEDEEQVTQAVDILQRSGTDLFFTRQAQDFTLRPAAYGACLVEKPADLTSSRQDERVKWRQVFLQLVNELFQSFNFTFSYLKHTFVGKVGRGS